MLCLVLQILLVIVDQEELTHIVMRCQVKVLGPATLRFLLLPPLTWLITPLVIFRCVFKIVQRDVAAMRD